MAIQADTLDGWLAALEQLHPTPIELGLTRVRAVAEQMGLQQMPCSLITVAGTNGKGSTVTYLDAIYRAAGYRSCCQFSPHMLRFNERIRLNGEDASDAQILEALRAVEAGRGDTSLTYFEYTVLAAVWLYHRAEPDVIILEVGLGGRLDACNIWDCDAAVVTNVSLDHERWLGDNREAIGAEKAAIARAGRPALVGDREPPQSLLRTLAEIGAETQLIDRDFHIEADGEGWVFRHADGELRLPAPGLAGAWQLANAACAVGVVRAMAERLPLAEEAIAEGLRRAHIAGRFQRGQVGGVEVVMDVGHNPDAARRLAEQLAGEGGQGRTLAVSAVMADKDLDGILAHLGDGFDGWYLGALEMDRALEPEAYRARLGALTDAPCHCFADLDQALDAAVVEAGEGDRVIVFGSFYTVAELIRRLD